MGGPIDALRAGGFNDDEITTWANQRRDALTTAGFADNDIDAYFTGGVKAPTDPSDGLLARAKRGWDSFSKNTVDVFWEGWEQTTSGPGKIVGHGEREFVDVAARIEEKLLAAGASPQEAKSEATRLRREMERNQGFLDAMMGPLQMIAAPLFGGIRAAGEKIEQETGFAKEGTEVIAQTGLAILGLRASGPRLARVKITPEGEVSAQQIGGLPKSEDFVNAAKAVTDETAPRAVQEKMLKSYQEDGIHPAELATDAASDPVLKQKLLSKDPAESPFGEPPEPPKPPAPAEPPPYSDAQKTILDKISVGDRDAKKPVTFDRLYTEAVDDLHPLKAVGEDAYELARLTRGQFGKAEHFLEQATFDFNTYKNTGRSLREILENVRDDLNGLRAYLASKRAVDLEASGRKSGFDMEAAAKVIAEGEGKYGKIAAELVDYQNSLIKYLRDSGMITDAAFEAMVEANKNYVPFYRLIIPEKAPPGSGSRFGPGNPLHRLKGSEREIIDPLESIIKNTYAYVSIAERNAAGIAVIDALKEAGFKVEVRGAAKMPAELADFLKEAGITDPGKLAEFIRGAVADEGETIGAYRAGKRETVKVNDPDLVAAFNGIDRQSVGLITRILSVPAKTLRAGAVLSPDFIARNLIRDFLTAFINTSRGIFTPFDTARGLVGMIRKDADFQNWVKAGGANSTFVAMDRAYLQESLAKLAGETGLMERGWNVITSPLRGLRMVSELAENATRLGEFKKAARGATSKEELQRAAYSSREVTLDFARMGASMRAYNMLTAFANAQIQGVDRMVRAFKDRPANTTLKIAGGVTLPSVLLWWANHEDQRYKDLPNWQKDLFWIILTNDWQPIDSVDAARKPAHLVRQQGGKWEFNNGAIWRIPKPFEIGVVFGSGVERALDATIGQNEAAFKGFTKSVLEVLTPSFIPTIAQPMIEQFSNRSTFTDRTLIPADLEKHLPEYQYKPYTTQLTRKLGQVIAAFPGMREASIEEGNPAGPFARAATTPILIENYVRGWTGGLGMYVLEAADAGLRKAGILPDPIKPTATIADIPFVKAFAVRYPSATTQTLQDFEDDYKQGKRFFDTWMARAKEGDSEAMGRIEKAGGVQMFMRLDEIHQVLTEHSKLVRDVYKNPDIKADEKRQLIDGLYYSMIEIGKAGRQMQKAIKHITAAP